MHEYAEGKLRSGSKKGPKVKSKSQALAIGYSEAKEAKKSSKSKGNISKPEKLHETFLEEMEVSKKKSGGSKRPSKKTDKVPDKNIKYPTLEFVGEVKSTDLENGKKGPENEEESKYAKKIAVKEAKSKGLREKERVNYFPKKKK